MAGTIPFGNNTDHKFNQALNMLAQSRSLSVSGLGAGQAGLFAYNAGRLYVLNAGGTAFELIATDSDKLNNQNAAYYLARGNHTGDVPASNVSGLAAAITATRLDQFAAPTQDVNMGGRKLVNQADGTAGTDSATWGQVLALINNQVFKDTAKVATTANIANLAGGAPSTLDGVALAVNDRVLVKDQSTGSQNGLYTVTTVGTGANGTWARAGDADSSAEVRPGIIVPVDQGTVGADKLYMLTTNGPITLGTTSLTFAPYGASSGEIGVAGNGLTKTGVTYDVGAGSGIIVTADAVAIDPAVVTRVVRGTIPSGGSASVNIVHALNLAANANIGNLVLVDRATGDEIKFGWTRIDGNTVSVVLPAAPSANQWDWTVIG